MPTTVLGVKIDTVSHTEALEKVAGFLSSQGQFKIFTPNPEMLVKAQKDEYFKKVLNSGDLNLCDGFGLWLALRLSFRPKRSGVEKSRLDGRDSSTRLGMTIERIAGVDFMLDICALAEKENKLVYLLGSRSDEVVKKTAENLQKQFPKLKIVGGDKGPAIKENVELRMTNDESIDNVTIEQLNNESNLVIHQQENDRIINQIKQTEPSIVFVAFGMGKQEKWIYENISKLPSVKIAMGVGGAFDYLSGAVPRAPLLIRKIGLEWVYRLLRQPKRAGRVFNATIKFIFYGIR